MKKLYATFAVTALSIGLYSQCMMQVSCNWVTCYGACDGIATANVNGVPPFTFQWMPGGQTTQTITGLCAGTYTCVMTDSTGCMATAQCTVGSPSPLNVAITSQQDASCQTCCDGFATATASGGIPGYVYWWSPSNQTTANAQALCPGTYTVCVTDMNGCTSCTTTTINYPTSLADNDNSSNMSVAPGSAIGIFQLTADFASATSGEIVVTNMLGEVVQQETFADKKQLSTEINLSNQSSGVFFVSVVTDEGIQTVRVIR